LKGLPTLGFFACVAAVVAAGCVGGDRSKATNDGEAPDAAASSPGGEAMSLDPCAFLSNEQVATVLPGHDGGIVARSGGSLIEGIDAYQCSYSARGADSLVVIFNLAVDDERFAELRPSSLAIEGARTLEIADGGWLRGEGDHVRITFLKGRTRIDLRLMVAGAEGSADALVELGHAIAAQVE